MTQKDLAPKHNTAPKSRTKRIAGAMGKALAKTFEAPVRAASRKAQEFQDRPLPEGSPAARAQVALDKLTQLRAAQEQAEGLSIIHSRDSFKPGDDKHPTEYGVFTSVELDIRRSELQHQLPVNANRSVVRITGEIKSPVNENCDVSGLTISRGSFVNPDDGSISDTIRVEVSSRGRETRPGYKSHYARNDTFTLMADAAGQFGEPLQSTQVVTHVDGYRLGGAGYQSMPEKYMPDQDGVNQNFANVLDMLEGLSAGQLAVQTAS